MQVGGFNYLFGHFVNIISKMCTMVPKAHDKPFIPGADTSFTLMYILWIYILLPELFVCRLMNSINWHRWHSAYLLLGFVYFPSLTSRIIYWHIIDIIFVHDSSMWNGQVYIVSCCSRMMLWIFFFLCHFSVVISWV